MDTLKTCFYQKEHSVYTRNRTQGSMGIPRLVPPCSVIGSFAEEQSDPWNPGCLAERN